MTDARRFWKDNHDIVETVISGICLGLSWVPGLKASLGFDPAWGSIIISGLPLLRMASVGLWKTFDVTAGVLVSIALIASVAVGEYFAAGEVAFIMAIGEILENRTVLRARSAVTGLMKLSPPVARVRRLGQEQSVPAESVAPGEEVIVLAGESIPVDGVVTEGRSSVNQASLTGESMPVAKELGSEALAGTINLSGMLVIRAAKTGRDTILARVTHLMEEAEKSRAPIVRTADRWARFLVPASMLTAAITWAVSGDVIRAVTILVVFCPCALVLATPTAIMAGVGQAAKQGILIKDGESAEGLGRVNTIVFDKTGTLTSGTPSVTSIASAGDSSDDAVLTIAVSLERLSTHPLADAIVRESDRRQIVAGEVQGVTEIPGLGVSGMMSGRAVGVGSLKFVQQMGMSVSRELSATIQLHEGQGESAVLVAQEGNIAGAIFIADRIRPNAKEVVKSLRALGVDHLIMLTGDNAEAAAAVARDVDISEYRHSMLPQDKLAEIDALRTQGGIVAMVGDGINDAPALAKADVGIAMGFGSGIALDTADIVLMSGDLGHLEQSLTLGRKMLRVITQNLWLSAAINLTAIVLASAGLMGPVIGALWHNAGSVFVVANSAMLMRLKRSVV